MDDLSYHYGVYMGDGFTQNYKPGSSVVYIGLKVIDRDFVEHYIQVMQRLTGMQYKMQFEKAQGPRRNPRFTCRVGNRELVEKTRSETALKTIIPASVMTGTSEMKKGFIQGVMDSEAWITCSLNPIGTSNIQLTVGVTDDWIKQLHKLFSEVGVTTTKIGTRKHAHDPKYLKPRKDFHSFSIHILEYVAAGLGFNIKRKQDRLEYCSRILRDFTREWPRYADYFDQKIKSDPM